MVLFRSNLFVRAPFAQTLRRSTEEGYPDTVVDIWVRSVQCVARGVRSKKISAGVDKTISRVFFLRCYFVLCMYPPFPKNVGIFAHICVRTCENGTACHNSGFLVQGQVWGTLLSKFGRAAYPVPCVTRACAVRNEMSFSLNKNRPPVQIALCVQVR